MAARHCRNEEYYRGLLIRIANAIGRGSREAVRNAVHTSIVTALIGGVIVAIIGELLAGPLLGMLNVTADVFPLALAYLRIYLIGMPGCGKSSAGRHLAHELGRPFVDLDEDTFAAVSAHYRVHKPDVLEPAVRFVCSWATTAEQVDAVLRLLGQR